MSRSGRRASVRPTCPTLPSCPTCPTCSVTCASCDVRRLAGDRRTRRAWRGAALIARPYVHGLSFVVRAAEMQGTRRGGSPTSTRGRRRSAEIAIPTARGSLRARVYAAVRGSHRDVAPRLGPASVRHRRAAPCRAGAAARRQRRRRRHAGHSRALAFEITPAITDAIEQGGRVARHRRGVGAGSAHRADGHQLQRRAVHRRRRPARR